ncbi:MAG: branched-chain amino acid ABC transporter permease/ATP-binding protein [Actinomycetota bacterium]|nr:branched-chain amino acid ABC transporter permease/ATP-binding protein [Actinomycetota bacterium]
MMSHFGFMLLGLGAGAAYAALGMALVVTYRSSGVINFASGSIAVYAAFVYAYLRQGKFVTMMPGTPKTVDIGGDPGFVLSLLGALVMSALLGLLLYALVFRPLRTAPPLARVVASLGIQYLIVLLIVRRMGTTQTPVKKVFPDSKIKLGTAVAHSDKIWTALTVVGVALLLSALFRFTRFGLATRAVAESEKGAVVSRISAGRVAALNWMLSSAVAGLAGVLIAPHIAVVPIVFSLFVVPSLAAAVVGRFEYIPATVIAGLFIGMLESEAQFLHATWSWFPKSGGPELVSLVIVIGVLVVRGKPLPARGALIARSLGRAPRPRNLWTTAVVATGIATVLMYWFDGKWRQALILSFVFGVVSLSLVVITGYAGQISLAQLTLAGTSAYMLSYFTQTWDIPFPIAPLMSATVAMIIGVVVGLPALRVRGLSVAVVTLSLAVTLDAAWFRNTDIVGFAGGVTSKEPTLFGWHLGWGLTRGADHLSYGLMALVTLVLVSIGVAMLRRSQLGSAMVAVRANERSAAAAGVNVLQVKLMAFAIGSFIAGLGGALIAYRYGTVNDQQFAPLLGLSVFATAYLAGITSVSGGIAAGFLANAALSFTAMNTWFEDSIGPWYTVITSLLLIVTVIANPEGMVGPSHVMADKLHARRLAKKNAGKDLAPEALVGTLVADPIDVSNLPTVLSITDLRVAYGGVVAVDQVSFNVPEGAIVGLIGPNGAGKTTMVDALSGFARHSGTAVFDGQDLEGLKAHQRVKLGLSRTFQAIELYEDLTVEENLEVGLASGRQGHGAGAMRSLNETCEVLGLNDVRERPASELSQGQRQLVSIGRALVAKPKLLLLDEPAAGLDSTESEWLGLRLRDVRNQGVTILMVDHDVNLVLNLCDYIVVLDFGKLIAAGTPAQIRTDPEVIKAYLGSTHSEHVASTEATS